MISNFSPGCSKFTLREPVTYNIFYKRFLPEIPTSRNRRKNSPSMLISKIRRSIPAYISCNHIFISIRIKNTSKIRIHRMIRDRARCCGIFSCSIYYLLISIIIYESFLRCIYRFITFFFGRSSYHRRHCMISKLIIIRKIIFKNPIIPLPYTTSYLRICNLIRSI